LAEELRKQRRELRIACVLAEARTHMFLDKSVNVMGTPALSVEQEFLQITA
jgi:hypothetical protein